MLPRRDRSIAHVRAQDSLDTIKLRKVLVMLTFQELIFNLERFWADHGCVIQQPYDVEKGAGTMNPATFLRVLGPEPWNVAYVEPSGHTKTFAT